ncbi:hypothetical protein [Pseudochelatococcus sp. G4_1912]|uniref:hypothetical protein n=1 Tax=Pseudochelatococcus sp. G4_1912 TaxID=3114288 RepID=UPI0039C645D3
MDRASIPASALPPGAYATTNITGRSNIGNGLGFTPNVITPAPATDMVNHHQTVVDLLTPVIPGFTPNNTIAAHNLADRQVEQHVAEWTHTQNEINNLGNSAGITIGCAVGGVAGGIVGLPAGPAGSIAGAGMGCLAGAVVGATVQGIAKDL